MKLHYKETTEQNNRRKFVQCNNEYLKVNEPNRRTIYADNRY